MKGKIIFLNGTSSSGKTVIAATLQNILQEPYLHLSIDRFLDMLPPRYVDAEQQEELTTADIDALGQCVPRIVSCFHECIAVFAANGFDVIVDHVLQDPAWLTECVRQLLDYPVLFVGVRCPLDELERREEERGREPGTARRQIETVHAHGIYDVEVDSFRQSPGEIAEIITEELKRISQTTAFRMLSEGL